MSKVCSKCQTEKPDDAFGKWRGICKPCRSAANRAWNVANSDKVSTAMSIWRVENAEHVRLYGISRRIEKPDVVAASFDKWRKKNLPKRAAKQSERRARQMQATPPWLSAIEHAQIQEFYEISECISVQTGVRHHVDHIVPLQAEEARGLHVPWNLQVIPAGPNLSKKNRMEVAS